ncbi:MAG: peptidoglycan DD-metalloendopeptidase family protein [Candidatus Paceibacterota bacterium]
MLSKYYSKFLILIITLSLGLIAGGVYLQAATKEELQGQISSKQDQIKQLDIEIANYQKKISQTGSQKASLNKELSILELSRKKLQADIAVTQNKISITNSTIKNLDQGIKTTAERVLDNQKALALSLRLVNSEEQMSLPEFIVSGENTTELWDSLSRYQSLGQQVDELISTLRQDKKELEGDKAQKEVEKKSLTNLEGQLTDQKIITEQTKQAKNTLLTETKNKESAYQKLLADKLKKKQQVESEILAAEAALRYTATPGQLPKTGTGVLAWPIAKVIITQGFGNTAFAKSNQGIYNGNGHNGIDLGTAIGTSLKSAGDGVVIGAGDTDLTCKGASYGKWILIGYDNGLASLYGHLSAIKVSEGQRVTTGQLVGYTGNTGYSTGPHLHFSVIAKEAVQVGSLKSKVPGCGTYRLPLAAFSAYLNPLKYL